MRHPARAESLARRNDAMNLEDYTTYLAAWFADPEHISTIDTCVVRLTYPHPLMWEWMQWDGVRMPDGALISLRTRIIVAEIRPESYEYCALWRAGEWVEVTRMPWTSVQAVNAFEGRRIAGMGDREIEDEALQQAFRQDVSRVRMSAL